MWIHSRSTGSHLVSPPSGARPSPPALFAQVGSTEPGNEILLLTPKARQAVGEPVSARSCFFFFMGGGLCTLCVMHTVREPGICCCFYGTTDSLCAPPTASVWLADCVREHYERWGWGGGGGGGVPLCPCAWLCFAISSLRGWCLWKRI